ncbi:MAG: hypothetical protein ACI9JN_000323 [Bacteroidia bacterium]|jgi:hypothetical protein
MKSSLFKSIIFVSAFVMLFGCELYYIPPQVQVPSHKQKGDISLNAQWLYSGSVSASYAFSDHGFIGASYMGYGATTDSLFREHFRVGTLEGGYYHYDSLSNIHFQVSAGLGSGQAGYASDGFQVDFDRFYLQPSIGFITVSNRIENHLSLRLSFLDYHEQTNPYVNPFNIYFIEPAYTFRAGSEYVKFHLQAGLSLPINYRTTTPSAFGYVPLFFGVGIQANFNALSKNR